MSETTADSKHRYSAQDLETEVKDTDTPRIITFKDLLEEEQRLTMEVKRHRTRVTENLNIMKARLQPANQALNFMSKLAGSPEKPGIVSHGVDIALDLLSKKYLFRKSNWFVTLAGSYLVRGLSQLFLSKARSGRSRGQQFGSNGVDQPIGDEMPNQ